MLTIKDLSASKELDRAALTTVRGGSGGFDSLWGPYLKIMNNNEADDQNGLQLGLSNSEVKGNERSAIVSTAITKQYQNVGDYEKYSRPFGF